MSDTPDFNEFGNELWEIANVFRDDALHATERLELFSLFLFLKLLDDRYSVDIELNRGLPVDSQPIPALYRFRNWAPDPDAYAAVVKRATRDLGCKLIFEPGRLIVGNAGILLTRVIYVKHGDAKNFIVIDAAMNDLIRPTLYEAYHDIIPVMQNSGARSIVADPHVPISRYSLVDVDERRTLVDG